MKKWGGALTIGNSEAELPHLRCLVQQYTARIEALELALTLITGYRRERRGDGYENTIPITTYTI